MRRFKKGFPCPVCKGWDTSVRGKGARCWGFQSDDGAWAYCTRSEFSDKASFNDRAQAWVHRLNGSSDKPPEIESIEYVYEDEKGEPLYKVIRKLPKEFYQARWDGQEWKSGAGCMEGVRRVPYRLPELLDSKGPILIVEGEKDVETALRLGFSATTNVGGKMKWRDDYSRFLKGREGVIIPDIDPDGGGEAHALQVAESFKRLGIPHRILKLPGNPKDFTAWIESGGSKEILAELVTPKLDWFEITGSPILTAADLRLERDKPIPYLLEPILIRGCLTQIHGSPKGGKSVFNLYVATCLAAGLSQSPSLKTGPPCKVLYISWEDVPGLIGRRASCYANGLGLGYDIAENLNVVYSPNLMLENDLHARLLAQIITEREYGVVLLDTFSYAHAVDENDASEIKPIMARLRRIAYDTQISIVYLHHSRKSKEGAMSERARGSTAISAAADVILEWGDRAGGNITPVSIISKWGFSGDWEIEYIPEGDEFVRWEISEKENLGKGKKQKLLILRAVQGLMPTHPEGVKGAELVEILKDQGLGRSSIYRYLLILCGEGKLTSNMVEKSTFYKPSNSSNLEDTPLSNYLSNSRPT